MAQRGFLSRVVAPERLQTEALASALRIAALAPAAARMNKQTLREIQVSNMPQTVVQQAQEATDSVADPYAYADSAEHREGINAFLAKRAPAF